GVNTKVLMLSETPVNNKINDLKNQIAFIKNDNPLAIDTYGIDDLDNELRLAQARYNEWSRLKERERTTSRFLEMINPGYFKILDLLTIARIESKSEFITTLMSSLASEESRSISENVTWGQHKRFSEGKATMPFSRCMGYDRWP